MCKHSPRKTDVIEVDPAAAVTLDDYDLINKIHPKLIGRPTKLTIISLTS